MDSLKLQASKSRIPVPVKSHRPSNLDNSKKKLKNSQQVKPVKTTQNNKCIQRVELNRNRLDSLRSNDICLDISKRNQSSKLKNSVKCETYTEKNIDKLGYANEKVIKSENTVSKSKIINDISKRKIAPLKINAQSSKSETQLKAAVKSSDSFKMKPPKCVSEKENKASSKPSWFAAQKDIKFEVNENSRNMILREHAPSPCTGNKMSDFRLSSRQSLRPSIYQPMAMPADPYKEAMRAIAEACLSAKRTQKSVKPEKPLKLVSPFKERNSFYTPCADPKREVMESLRKLKLKRQQQLQLQLQPKSTKKVTFNLNVIEHTPKNDSDTAPKLLQESKLSQINEKSEENTPNSPEIKKVMVSPTHDDKSNAHSADCKENNQNYLNNNEIKVTEDGQCEKLTKSIPPSIITNIEPESYCKDLTSPTSKAIDSPVTNVNDFLKCVPLEDKIFSKHGKTINQEKILMNKESVAICNQTTVFTPRPISFFSKSELKDSCSPEFLVKGTSKALVKEAPICTPLVLKRMAKNNELSPDMEVSLSPVRLKLDFTEKKTPRKEISEFHPLLKCKQITTYQSKLDELADQECCIWLDGESIPVVCGRYITNPVAQILAEGDEMHFIPLKF